MPERLAVLGASDYTARASHRRCLEGIAWSCGIDAAPPGAVGVGRLRKLADVARSTPAIRGRDSELAVLGEHLGRLRSGVGGVLLLEGAAGIGKSRLLDEAAEAARRNSCRVGWAAADPGDSVVALAVLMAALFDGDEPLLERAALGDLRALPEHRYWLLQHLQALLEKAALDAPLLVCLDDAQWSDSGTAAALRALPVRLASVPIIWIVAFRPDQGSGQLTGALQYLARHGAEKITLGPLDDDAVAELAADALHAQPDDALLEMARRSHGSPFLLVELLSGMREEGLVRVHSGRAELVDSRLPLRVRDSMRERLARVSERAREAATVAASLGRRFSFGELAAMLDLSPAALLGPVRELIEADLLVDTQERLEFRHDITREAVRDSVPVSARRALDRHAIDVLLAGGALPVEVAIQLAASAELGDEIAITTLFKAAKTLETTDPGAAADLSRRAFEIAPPRHALRGPLAAQTAVLLHAAGRPEEARAFADTSLRDTLPAEQEARVRLSIAGMFSISPDVRVDTGRQALALPDLPPGLRAQHLSCLVHNLNVGGRFEEGRANLAEARAAVGDSGDATALFILDFAENGLAYFDGRFERALELTEMAIRSGAASQDLARERLTHAWRCELLSVLDRVDESVELTASGVAAAQRDRQGWALRIFENWRGRQSLQLGRLHDAAAILEGQFSPEDDEPHDSILDAPGVVALGRVALHTGDARLRRRTETLARAMLDHGPLSFRRHGAWLLALQAMASGDAAAARAWLTSLGEEERKSIVPLFPLDVTDEVDLVRIANAAGDHELAESAVAAAERRAEMNPDVRMIAATAAHARGLLSGSHDDLARAVELFDAGPRPLALDAALEDLGAARVGDGTTSDGIEALDRALVLCVHTGATWDAGRVRSRLRGVGVRRRVVSAQRPGKGWAAMTTSEVVVARLVAEGLTNRAVAEQLFVSQHTVSSHLRHVFEKLEINSRAELRRVASDQHRSD